MKDREKEEKLFHEHLEEAEISSIRTGKALSKINAAVKRINTQFKMFLEAMQEV